MCVLDLLDAMMDHFMNLALRASHVTQPLQSCQRRRRTYLISAQLVRVRGREADELRWMTERTNPLLEWKVDLESEDLFQIVIELWFW